MSKEFLDIHATIECGFTLKRVGDMTRTYSHHVLSLKNKVSLDLVILPGWCIILVSTFLKPKTACLISEGMGALLSQIDAEDLTSEMASSVATTSVDTVEMKIDGMTVAQRMSQLKDVRKRLRQLHGFVSEYEVQYTIHAR